MRISYKGDYALKAILELAKSYNNGVVTIHDIAGKINAPKKFLEQVLLELKHGGFVGSKRGNIGGYFLTRPPSQIKLGDVVQYVDGPIEPIPCVNDDYNNCEVLPTCVFRPIWKQVAQATQNIVNNITIEDLAKKAKAVEEPLAYSI